MNIDKVGDSWFIILEGEEKLHISSMDDHDLKIETKHEDIWAKTVEISEG